MKNQFHWSIKLAGVLSIQVEPQVRTRGVGKYGATSA